MSGDENEQRWRAASAMAAIYGDALGGHFQVDRFDIERPVARGGHGEVYRAMDPMLERPVALKLARRNGVPGRQLREARAVARISHPNVVKVHDVGEVEGEDSLWIAMEWIEGETLREWAARASRVEKLRALSELADGLAAIHRAGVLHRDITPSNIMVEAQTGRAVIIDLGLAQRKDPTERVDAELGPVGTPGYVAPELDGDLATERSDQWSWGRVAEEVLGGGGGPRVRAVVRRALAEEPGARWPNMQTVRDELRAGQHSPWKVTLVGVALLVASAASVASVGGAASSDASPATIPRLGLVEDLDRVHAAMELAARGQAMESFEEWANVMPGLCVEHPVVAGGASLLFAKVLGGQGPAGKTGASWVAHRAARCFEDARWWGWAAMTWRRAAAWARAAGDDSEAQVHEMCASFNDEEVACLR